MFGRRDVAGVQAGGSSRRVMVRGLSRRAVRRRRRVAGAWYIADAGSWYDGGTGARYVDG
jgi:hypothetical protein